MQKGKWNLIFRFEGFRYALFFGKLFYQPRKHCFCRLVEVCKVIVQLAGSQQFGIQADLVLADISQVSLSTLLLIAIKSICFLGNRISV